MKKHTSNYRRGEASAVIVVVVALIIVAVLGWVFYSNFVSNDEPAKNVDSSAEVDSDNSALESIAYKGERVYSIDESISLKVPNGWAILRSNDNPSALYTPMIGDKKVPTYNEDEKPEVTTYDEGAPSNIDFSIAVVDDDDVDNEGTSVEFTTESGTKGTRVVSEGPKSGIDGEAIGYWYSRTYIFTKNDKTVKMIWSREVPTGEEVSADTFALIDAVAQTVEIK